MSADIRRITPADGEWPIQLNQLNRPPRELFIRGRALNELLTFERNSLAIVGARNSTYYGEKIARD
ncbi:MAG: DNA-protecting protein DprA, partial [Actinobacteria bacterium]|nr:DNA-protecting protein DprA [Actinomycetota bacterium]